MRGQQTGREPVGTATAARGRGVVTSTVGGTCPDGRQRAMVMTLVRLCSAATVARSAPHRATIRDGP